jgi:DNA-binding protein HU-beta
MNRAELIDVLARKLGTDHRYATAVLDNFLDTIVRAVHRGDRVTITGFGVFEQRRRVARVVRNPRTGETVKVKPTSVPSFRPGAQFKAVVSGAERLQPEEPAAKPGGGGVMRMRPPRQRVHLRALARQLQWQSSPWIPSTQSRPSSPSPLKYRRP